MNPVIIWRSIKAFIRTYQSDLVDGLDAGGEPKVIRQISTSRFTHPIVPIFIAIVSPSWEESFDATKMGTAIDYSKVAQSIQPDNRYEIEIHVGDYASHRSGEDPGEEYEEFEKDTETFWIFVSRLVDLFREYTPIPSESGSFTIEVYGDGSSEDRKIAVRDLSQQITEATTGETYNYLYALISFRVGTCDEPSPL